MPGLLLITPPFTQLNTPYPATTYLTGALRSLGVETRQADLSLETALRLFSRDGLGRLFAAVRARPNHDADERPEVSRALSQERRYLETVDRVVRFLQGRDPTFATRICQGDVLPEGPRHDAAREAEAGATDDDNDDDAQPQPPFAAAFGAMGTTDRARYLATLYLDDLSDLARETVAPRFGLSRYGEELAAAAATYDALADALAEPPGLIDELAMESLQPHLTPTPTLVGLTVPFPGNLYGALRLAQAVRRLCPSARVALGGGYPNTELRQLAEPRLFDLIDFVTLDDGERPLACLMEHLDGRRPEAHLKRTFLRKGRAVRFVDGATEPDLAQAALPAPTYDGLPLDRYLSVIEVLNPMHRLWSDGRWNKLTVAHGCYWKKCTFCDVHLDYIGRYDPTPARALADKIDALVAETGESGFHFVDEAAPPLALIELALELCARGRTISWWGNIRFEKTFTTDVCRLLAASGCIAVTGGLEVASDRLLALIDKGVTVAQAARVGRAFADAGVLVHAYLMYGFPTESAADTVESLELVRQLFAHGAIHSAFWHRFALTTHSPIAAAPDRFHVRVLGAKDNIFANNDLAHEDPTGCDPAPFAEGLRRALFNYMHGAGLDLDVRTFLKEAGGSRLPRPRVAPDTIERALGDDSGELERRTARLAWLGGVSEPAQQGRQRGLIVVGRNEARFVPFQGGRSAEIEFVQATLERATPRSATPLPRLPELAASFPGGAAAFARLIVSPGWRALEEMALVRLP